MEKLRKKSHPSSMPHHSKQRNILAYTLMFSVGVLFLVLAYFATSKEGFLYFLFKEIGFALIVAIFLVGTIERFTRERHEAAAEATMEEINRNLFYAIFKRYIPEKVFEEVEKAVMEAKVVRTGHQLDYTIEMRQPENDKVICQAQTSYRLTSVVDGPIEHNIVVNLEMPIEDSDKDECFIKQLTIDGTILNRDDLIKYVKRSDDHITLSYPHKIEGRASVRISTHSQLIKKSTDVELWASRIPSDGLELTVCTPDRNLKVHAYANHSEKLTKVTDNNVTNRWTLQYGIFPYQSIMFWWLPKSAKELKDLSSATSTS